MSTILFYESNRLSLWHGGAAQPLLVLLGESDERSQAIAPAVSERDRGWFGWLEHHDRQFSRTYTRAIRQPRSGKNIAASQNARGSGHLCLLLGWGSAVWRETEEGGKKADRGQKKERKRWWNRQRQGSKQSQRVLPLRVVYLQLCVIYIAAPEERSAPRQTDGEGKDMWPTQT